MQFPSYEQDWVGRITYNFDERYLLELNAAYTASEKFAPGKRYGFFPSYSVGWRLSEEEWLKKYTMKYLTNLKVRYSYGEVGNDLGAPRFNYIQTFTSGGNAQFGLDQDYNWGPIYSEGKLADINATWERATKQNIGIEIGLFNKLNLIIDLYDEKRKNILMVRNTVPSWLASSATLPAVNLGKTKNHGLEIEANWNDRIDKVNYYLKLNFATSENRIVYRDDPRNLPFYMKQEGKSIGFQSKYLATGNFQSLDDIFNSAQSAINNGLHDRLVPGDLYSIDFNGDGSIDLNDQVPIADLDYLLTKASFTIGGEW